MRIKRQKPKSIRQQLVKAKIQNIVLLFFIIWFLFSCNGNKENIKKNSSKLVGQWAIESLNYNGINYKDSLYINFLVFENNNYLSIPEGKNIGKDLSSNWQYKSKNKSLIIESKNYIFKGDFSVIFFKNSEKKILGAEFKSNNTYFKAYKLLQDYDSDGENW
jgi:hypothetical protein